MQPVWHGRRQQILIDAAIRAQTAGHIISIIVFFDPGTQFPGNEKNYTMQYKKVQKSSWNEPYFSSSFTKWSCSKTALYR